VRAHRPGFTSGRTIGLGANAAGWGRFDPAPRDGAELTTPGNQGRRDRLTVRLHDTDHLLGRSLG
jgi:hypothetical protein